jgi:hypothetical protein
MTFVIYNICSPYIGAKPASEHTRTRPQETWSRSVTYSYNGTYLRTFGWWVVALYIFYTDTYYDFTSLPVTRIQTCELHADQLVSLSISQVYSAGIYLARTEEISSPYGRNFVDRLGKLCIDLYRVRIYCCRYMYVLVSVGSFDPTGFGNLDRWYLNVLARQRTYAVYTQK